jgi:hypothetical protein
MGSRLQQHFNHQVRFGSELHGPKEFVEEADSKEQRSWGEVINNAVDLFESSVENIHDSDTFTDFKIFMALVCLELKIIRRLLHGINLDDNDNEARVLKAIDEKDYKNYTTDWPGEQIKNLKNFEEY